MYLRAQAKGKFPVSTPKLEGENMQQRGKHRAKKETYSRLRGSEKAPGRKWVVISALRDTQDQVLLRDE